MILESPSRGYMTPPQSLNSFSPRYMRWVWTTTDTKLISFKVLGQDGSVGVARGRTSKTYTIWKRSKLPQGVHEICLGTDLSGQLRVVETDNPMSVNG